MKRSNLITIIFLALILIISAYYFNIGTEENSFDVTNKRLQSSSVYYEDTTGQANGIFVSGDPLHDT